MIKFIEGKFPFIVVALLVLAFIVGLAVGPIQFV